MGFILRAIKKEMFSMATIIFVLVPALHESNLLPSGPEVTVAAQSFFSHGPAQDLKGIMQGIGQVEASAVMKTLNLHTGGSYTTNHAPIFLASAATY